MSESRTSVLDFRILREIFDKKKKKQKQKTVKRTHVIPTQKRNKQKWVEWKTDKTSLSHREQNKKGRIKSKQMNNKKTTSNKKNNDKTKSLT